MPHAIKASSQKTAWKPQKRGPDGKKRQYVERRIHEDIASGYYATLEQLNKTPRKEIYYKYRDMPGVEEPLSRSTVMDALRNVLQGGSMH